MKKVKINTLKYFIIFLCLSSIWACSKIDDYKDHIGPEGEISYSGKLDSLMIFSGRNRVLVNGLIISDPKITESRIFWNSNTDSLVVPIDRSNGVDTLSVLLEGLMENVYSFEVRTYDSEGNRSIPVSAIGTVYGDRYQSSLINRPVITNNISGTNMTINYGAMDLSTGVIGTEVEYTTINDVTENIFVPIGSTSFIIDNFKGATDYFYRTLYLPNPTCIDTFYTEFTSHFVNFEATDPPYFVNASFPFDLSDFDGTRWGTPADWIHNSGALSHNGYGAHDGNSERFDLESGWGEPDITNGKVYQTMNLPAGTYAYTIDIFEGNYDENDDKAYFVVAEGNTLPDVDDVESSASTIVYERINMANGLNRTLSFTLTEEITEVAIGIETTNSNAAGKYFQINSFELNKFTEAPYFQNASDPFEKLEWDGTRWGTPLHWIHNDSALNHNGYGALDNDIFDLESGWGEPDITNGKVYQTMTLAAGTYTYTIDINEGNYDENDDKAYFIVAAGSTLPDVDDVETSASTIVFERINIANGLLRTLEFTLTEASVISIGIETTNSNEAGKYLKINSFSLTL